jgi:hypothetical protein
MVFKLFYYIRPLSKSSSSLLACVGADGTDDVDGGGVCATDATDADGAGISSLADLISPLSFANVTYATLSNNKDV